MRYLRQIIGVFRDSPTFGQYRANLLSGMTIGTTGLLLNAAVFLFVLPLMLDPDSSDFRTLTENIEFGQVLALILLGGATLLATLVIPLRLMTVFWGPRTGNYFDQIVLSGITPFRFQIGKATSQNMFLCLVFFLLLPWLVLSLTLGGVDPVTFVAGVFLVWLYCMMLALMMLWASLHMNELLAACLVIGCTTFFGFLGSMPIPWQPIVLTPMPVLLQPVYSVLSGTSNTQSFDFGQLFLLTAGTMCTVCVVALCGIGLGPLYGIVRENSTFGEVVCKGDSIRKRRFRLRLHIQRPSEISFFYENRTPVFRQWEAVGRWGTGMAGLLLASGIAFGALITLIQYVAAMGAPVDNDVTFAIHSICQAIHGVGLILAILMFSHSRNTTYLTLPLPFGRTVSVSHLDTAAFLFFMLTSSALAITTPAFIKHYVPGASGLPLFQNGSHVSFRQSAINVGQLWLEGTTVLTVSGITIYALHRMMCLRVWQKLAAWIGVALMYLVLVCIAPLFISVFVMELQELQQYRLLQDWAPSTAMCSPVTVLMNLYREMGSRFPASTSSVPFYLTHGIIFTVSCVGIKFYGRGVQATYLPGSSRGLGQ